MIPKKTDSRYTYSGAQILSLDTSLATTGFWMRVLHNLEKESCEKKKRGVRP